MGFDKRKDVLDFIRSSIDADSGRKNELERSGAISASYYGGLQYRRPMPRMSDFNGGVARLSTDIDPDSAKLRVTTNRTAPMIQKVAVATFPESLQITVTPPPHDGGMDATVRAQVYEDALIDMAKGAGFLPCRREVNFHRGVWGSYGQGLRIRRGENRKVKLYGSEVELADTDLEFFDFSPIELTLDPYCKDRDLLRHDWIIHHTVWSVNKAKRWLGALADKVIDESKCQTIGELAPYYTWLNKITDGQLYAQYADNSQTKGVIVHQVHQKDSRGRHSIMFTVVEGGGAKVEEDTVVNFEDPESPFGGSGLPLAWYHAHRRTDGPYGLSDAAMLKDDQDKLNLADTAALRQQLRAAGWQWLVDKGAFDRGKTDDDFRNVFSNTVGGAILYDAGSPGNEHQAPQLVKYPQSDSMLAAQADRYEKAMLEQVHRAQVNSGLVKSHTSDAVVQAAIEQSDQVLGARSIEDNDVDAQLLEMAMGTLIKQVQTMSPCTLGRLRRAGFDEDGLALLYDADPVHIAPTIECNIHRYRSPNMRRQELKEGVVNKVIGPAKFRRAMVDLDMAVDDEDRFYERRCEEIALDVQRGKPFTPIMLGPEWNEWLLAALRRARLDRICFQNPEAGTRLDLAIQSQEQVAAAQVATAQGAAQGLGQPGVASGGTGDVGDDSFEQVIANLGASPAGGQPALGAA